MCPATNIWTSGRFCPVKMYLQQFTKVFLWRLHCKHLTCPPLAALVSDNHCIITAHYGRPLGQAIIFCSCGFYFFLSFFLLFFLAYSQQSQIGWMSTRRRPNILQRALPHPCPRRYTNYIIMATLHSRCGHYLYFRPVVCCSFFFFFPLFLA